MPQVTIRLRIQLACAQQLQDASAGQDRRVTCSSRTPPCSCCSVPTPTCSSVLSRSCSLPILSSAS
jgi:hypothetical protein